MISVAVFWHTEQPFSKFSDMLHILVSEIVNKRIFFLKSSNSTENWNLR